jgi:hypothetical protein
MFSLQQDIVPLDFGLEEITDIREILFEDKSLECELLRIERDSYKREAESWKNLYESASNLINSYCRGSQVI